MCAAQMLGMRGERAYVCALDDDGRLRTRSTYERDRYTGVDASVGHSTSPDAAVSIGHRSKFRDYGLTGRSSFINARTMTMSRMIMPAPAFAIAVVMALSTSALASPTLTAREPTVEEMVCALDPQCKTAFVDLHLRDVRAAPTVHALGPSTAQSISR